MKLKKIGSMCAAAAVATVITITPLRASEADDRIESSFKKTYVYEKYLKADSVTIDSQDGVVTLTGTVEDESHKTLAEETAANLPKVTRVDNQLATKNEAAAENSDAWIARKVKLTLMFHRHVSYSATTVDVKDGIVTLKGEATNLAQKDLTAEYASDVDGVKSVKNEMTVAATPAKETRTEVEIVDDASITAQVKTVLAIHRSTKSLNTKIVTRNGEVTVTGIAKNETQKALSTKLITDVQGVTSVKNLMTVE